MPNDNGENFADSYAFVDDFVCKMDGCEDTCCGGWSMQIDPRHAQIYKERAPELLDFVAKSRDGSHSEMKRCDSGKCTLLEGGICSVHRDYGEDFLGDACNFYPRIIRFSDGRPYMAASMSCPEIARLILEGDDPFARRSVLLSRIPQNTHDFLPRGLDMQTARQLHEGFIRLVDGADTPESAVVMMSAIAPSLSPLSAVEQPARAELYCKIAATMMPDAESDSQDIYRLLLGLATLIYATKDKLSTRLGELFVHMQAALGAEIDMSDLTLTQVKQPDMLVMKAFSRPAEGVVERVLRRYIKAQLVCGFFPYGGLGDDMEEKVAILGFKVALVKFALICGCEPKYVVQSLSRFLDHLEDPTLTHSICRDAGWTCASRLRSLLAVI